MTCRRTNNANNATHYVKLGKKRREISKLNYYIISPRIMMIAIIIIRFKFTTTPPRPLTYYHTYPLDVYHVIIQAVALRLLRDGVLHRP